MGDFTDLANKMIHRLFDYAFIVVICTYMCIRLAIMFVLNPTERFWNPQIDDKPPACLSDPELGKHGYVQTKGVRLHYVEKGDRSKPLMLCLHGYPEFWYSWRHILKAFSSDYWVVAVDMRGYGDSDKPLTQEQYKMTYLVEDIKDCIKALGRDKCTLVAHDWGGFVAWSLLMSNPQLVDSYVIINSANRNVFKRNLSLSQRMKSWYIYFYQIPRIPEICCRMNNMKIFDIAFNTNSTFPLSEEDIEAFKYTFRKQGAFTGPINYYRANFLVDENPDESKSLGRNSNFPPGLVLFGEKDVYLEPITQELSVKMVENASLVYIKDANHFSQQDNPKAVIKEMSLFFSKIPKKYVKSKPESNEMYFVVY